MRGSVGKEVECATPGCANKIVKRSPAHRYCERCRILRKRKSQSLHYKIKGSDRRKRQREQQKKQ